MAEQARVELPAYVQGDVEVYLNGVPQAEGRDFQREPSALVFDRPLEREGQLGPIRWLSMLLGIAGTYRKNDTVDVVYTSASGKRTVATGLPFVRGSD